MRRRAMFSTLLSGDNGGGNEGGGGGDSIVDNYLTLEALEDGFTAQLSQNACEYCVDGDGVWLPLPAATDTPAINAGQTISLRAEITPSSSYGSGTISTNKTFNAKGNPLSLLANNTLVSRAFYNLFRQSKIISAKDLQIPDVTLSYCCAQMFTQCASLVEAPAILPALTLANYCYSSMFNKCKSLVVAPVLPATTLVTRCYHGMFKECSELSYVKAMFLTTPSTSSSGYTYEWLYGVAATGTFVKNAAAKWTSVGTHAVPSGWTIETATE